MLGRFRCSNISFAQISWLLAALTFFFVQSSTLIADPTTTLKELDEFIAQYRDFKAFLADDKGQQNYREKLKSYMGYDSSFDPIFAETIAQMKILNTADQNFGIKIWRNAAQGEKVIVIEGSKTQRTGFETDRSSIEKALTKSVEIYQQTAEPILKIKDLEQQRSALKELEANVSKRLAEIEGRYSDEIRNPSGAALKRMNQDPQKREQRKAYIEELRSFASSDRDLKILTAALRYKILTEESWLDVYRRNFAEDSLLATKDLDKLSGADTGVDRVIEREMGAPLDPRIRDLSVKTDTLFLQANENFERLRKAKKELNQRLTPREPPEVVQELQQIQAQDPGIDPAVAQSRLSPKSAQALSEYRESLWKIYHEKQQILQAAHNESIFRIPVVNEPDRATIEFRMQNSDAVTLTPMHALHASFSGGRTKECVGGASAAQLTPRRWALSAADGVRSYAAEKGGKFDGVARLIKVQTSEKADDIYETVDVMINAISDTQEIRSDVTGQSAKYPLFDAILDQLVPAVGSKGFVAGDGHAISQNTGLAKVYSHSPSVISSERLATTVRFQPLDLELQTTINAHFPNAAHGYNPGGMIFEGMPGDGAARYILTPRKQRPKFTVHQLESMLVRTLIEGTDDLSNNHAWSLAVESDVKLRPLGYYQNLKQLSEEPVFKETLIAMMASKNENDQKVALDFLESDRAKHLPPDTVKTAITEDLLNSNFDGVPAQVDFAWRLLASKAASHLQPQVVQRVVTAKRLKFSMSRSYADEAQKAFNKFLTSEVATGVGDTAWIEVLSVSSLISIHPEPINYLLEFLSSDRSSSIRPAVVQKLVRAQELGIAARSSSMRDREKFYVFLSSTHASDLDANVIQQAATGPVLAWAATQADERARAHIEKPHRDSFYKILGSKTINKLDQAAVAEALGAAASSDKEGVRESLYDFLDVTRSTAAIDVRAALAITEAIFKDQEPWGGAQLLRAFERFENNNTGLAAEWGTQLRDGKWDAKLWNQVASNLPTIFGVGITSHYVTSWLQPIQDAVIDKMKHTNWPPEVWEKIKEVYTKRQFKNSVSIWLMRDLINTQKNVPDSFFDVIVNYYQSRRSVNSDGREPTFDESWVDHEVTKSFARLIEEREFNLPEKFLYDVGKILPRLDAEAQSSLIHALGTHFKRQAYEGAFFKPRTDGAQFPEGLYRFIAGEIQKYRDGTCVSQCLNESTLDSFFDAVTASQKSVPLWFEAEVAKSFPHLPHAVVSTATHAFAEVHDQAPYTARQVVEISRSSKSGDLSKRAVLKLRLSANACSKALAEIGESQRMMSPAH